MSAEPKNTLCTGDLADPTQATLQRWISRDPLGSVNRYVYCDNLPTDFIDIDGMKSRKITVWKEIGNTGKYAMTNLNFNAVVAALKSGQGNFWLKGGAPKARMQAAMHIGTRAWGRNNVVVHPPQGGGANQTHVQPANRNQCPTKTGYGRGHIFFGHAFMFLNIIGNIQEAQTIMAGGQAYVIGHKRDPWLPEGFNMLITPLGYYMFINDPGESDQDEYDRTHA